DLRGGPVVLTFVYTHCPDVCPLYLGQISEAIGQVDPAAAGSTGPSVVVVTVDPARDTTEHFAAFAHSWPARWHFLTGKETDLARIWSAYGVDVESEATFGHHVDATYAVAHTAKAVLIDADGHVSEELKGRWETSELVEALGRLAGAAPPGTRFGVSRLFGDLVARCGEFASTQPWVFVGLVALIMLPGLILPAYLLAAFLRTPAHSPTSGVETRPEEPVVDASRRHRPPVA
ncbi:MAG: SCO family protein, partial [Chloroflexi bacterium]|nr:SCO family protein [Chloroflexota bacterium]